MSSARDDLGVTIRVPVARRPPAWTPPPADRARRGGGACQPSESCPSSPR